jgi:hypothetical protein
LQKSSNKTPLKTNTKPNQIPNTQLTIKSPGLGRALFELYLGDGAIVPELRGAAAEGARALLESEEVKRAARKAGA